MDHFSSGEKSDDRIAFCCHNSLHTSTIEEEEEEEEEEEGCSKVFFFTILTSALT